MGINKSFIEEVKYLVSSSRQKVYSTVNSLMIESYWLIGLRIVEEEQKGETKADYGKKIIEILSKELTKEFGSGFSMANLKNFRQFYLTFPYQHDVSDELSIQEIDNLEAKKYKKNQVLAKSYAVRSFLQHKIRPELTWTHYRLIMRVENPKARTYYMNEAANENWSTRNLERNIQTFYYERILSSKDKEAEKSELNDELSLALDNSNNSANSNNEKHNIRDFIKNPFVLEFLGLPTNASYKEKELEMALITHIQSFLLELGKGFAFLARQQNIRTELSDFFIDLVFYNYELQCFVLIDLKTTKLTHQDIGQMDMYVRMYDDLKRRSSDNPTIGIILCSESDSVVAKYSVLKGSEQLFASKYSAVLPSESDLKAEIEREIKIIQDKLENKEENK